MPAASIVDAHARGRTPRRSVPTPFAVLLAVVVSLLPMQPTAAARAGGSRAEKALPFVPTVESLGAEGVYLAPPEAEPAPEPEARPRVVDMIPAPEGGSGDDIARLLSTPGSRDSEVTRAAGRRLANKSGKAQFFFADRADAPVVVETGGKGWSVGFGVESAAPAAAHVEGNRVTYPDALPGIDLVYVVADGHVKELLRVKAPEAAVAAARVLSPLRVGGVRPVSAADGVEFLDRKGKVRATMPAGVAVDSATPAAVAPVRYELVDDRAVAVVTDPAWLTASERVFPILVDPTLAGSAPNAPVNTAPANNGSVSTLTPTLSATYSDPDAESGTCTFYVVDVLTNAQVWTGSSASVANNTTCSAVVGTSLSNSRSYRWYATGRDATGLVGTAGATWTFRVAVLPTVTKTSPSTLVAKGELVPYTVTVTNPIASPMRVNGLTDVLPSGLAATGVGVTNPGTPPTTCAANAAPPEPACKIVSYPGGANRDVMSSDGPAGWWRLDDPTGTVAADSSGNSLTGTYVGTRASTTGAIAADLSTAATFNGVDSVVTVPHNATLALERDTAFTVAAWVKTTSSAIQVVASKMNEDAQKRGWQLFLENGLLNFQQASDVAAGDWVGVRGVHAVNDGAWHHVAVTRTAAGASGLTLYVDGVADARVVYQDSLTTTASATAGLRLGSRVALNFLNGSMDEAAVYGRALSADEVAEHATTGTRTSQVRVGAFTLAANASRTFTIRAVATGVVHPTGTGTGMNTGDCTGTTIVNDVVTDAQGSDGYEQTVKADNPSDYLRLGETAGTTAANLIGASGTYTGGVSLGATGALPYDPDRAPRLDGASGHVALPAGQANFSTGFSVSAWVYPTTSANSAKVIDFGSGATLDNIFLGRSGTTAGIELGVHDGTTLRTITSGAKLVNNQWQHVAATVSSTGVGTVYHNGIAVASGTVGIPRNTTRLNNYLGKSNNATHAFWAGGEDEVAVYPSVLSAARVKAHYEAGTSSLLARRVSASGVQACENRLGIEDWWQYVERKVGPGGTAKVNVSNGNLVLQQEDGTRSQAHGHLALSFRRTYNSLDTGRLTLPNSLGSGWTLDIGQVGAVTGSAMTAGALYVPPPNSALDQVLQPLPLTLIDRDGTRHQFQPKQLSAVASVPVVGGGALAPRALVRGGVGLCVDQTYNAPPGVYVSMWRYVQVNSGDCSNVTGTTSQVLGYGAIRSDRLRYEFSATGELVSMTDASGVEVRYLYAAAPVLPASGLPASLGRLQAVFESTASSCKKLDGTVPVTLAEVPSVCRALRLTWTGSPNATQVAVLDAAGRTTTYLLTGTSPNYLMGVENPDGTTIRYTYQGITWNGVTGGCFSTVTGQLCTTTDLKSQTTTVNYRAASIDGFNSAQRPVVRTLADRKGNTTTFTYNSGTSTFADMATRRQRFDKIDSFGRVGAVNEGSDTNAFLKQTFYAWDGVADPTRQTPDVATPDPTRVGCRSDDKGPGHAGNVVANNLCRTVRKAVVTSQYPLTTARSTTAADDDRRFLYNPEGNLLLEKRSDRAPSSTTTGPDPGPTYNIVTTTGHQVQYTPGSGATTVYRDVVAGSGGFLPFAARAAAATAVYFVSDETEKLTPRGNLSANASSFATYRSTVVPDAPQPPTATTTSYTATPAAPDTFDPTATACGPDGTPTRNTGLTCEVSTPGATSDTGTVSTARTQSRYDGYGQKLTEVRPNVVADPSAAGNTTADVSCPLVGTARRACYSFAYYDDATLDLSGNVSVGGWLKAAVDPTGKFVAYAYDRAGNVVRTWDRNATAGRSLTDGWQNAAAPAANYSESLYGPRPNAPVEANAAYKYPWRWQLSTADQLGDKTTYAVDGNGNRTQITPPRGNVAGNTTDYATVQAFDNNDNLSTRSTPLDRAAGPTVAARYTYDAHDNQTLVVDSLGRRTVSRYDSVNRLVRSRWSRGTALATTPMGCPQVTGDTEGFPDTTNVCDTATAYDAVNNVVKTWDANQNPDDALDVPRMTAMFDGAHRKLRETRLRNDNGVTDLVSSTAYDVDGNATDVCSPRQVVEGGAAPTDPCPANPRFGEHRDYDPAGRVLRSATVRNQVSGADLTLEAKTSFDANGNVVKVTDANGHVTTTKYDVLDRKVETGVPRTSNVDMKLTTFGYNPSGDTTRVDKPGAVGTRRITDYTYDAAHRLTDKVAGAVGTTSPCPVSDDATVAGSKGGCNIRTRSVYDADGHVVAQYDPRAFVGNPTTPNAEFMVRTDYDANGRAMAQHVPRYAASGAGADPGIGTDQPNQCPASVDTPPIGTPQYPSGVGVCVTKVSYDLAGNRTALVLPTTGPSSTSAARTVTFTYTADNLLLAERTPSPARVAGDTTTEAVTTYSYDGNAKPVLIDLPRGSDNQARQQTTTYTADQLVKVVTQPAGNDPANPVSHTTTNTYNANGQVTTAVDGNGKSTTSTYFTNGAVQETTQGASTAQALTTRYDYDNVGNPTRVFSPSAVAGDANNPHGAAFPTGLASVNRYTFDNLLERSYQPVTSTAATSPTAAGSTWRLTTYAYDDGGRKTSVDTAKVTGTPAADTAPPDNAYTVDESAGAQTFAYYASDRLRSESGRPAASGGTGTITSGYDAAGNRNLVSDTTNGSPGTCDAAGTVVGGAPATTLCARYYADNLVRNVDDGAWSNTFAYDGSGARVGRRDRDKTAAVDYTTRYANNDAGLPVTVTSSVFGADRSTTLTYDAAGRPATQTNPNPASGTGQQQASWTFNTDSTVRQLSVTKGGSSLATWGYTYNGNLQRLTETFTGLLPGGSTPVSRNFTYQYNDGANRLTAFTDSVSGVTMNTKWDSDGNRLGWGPDASQCGTGTLPTPNTTTCFVYRADDSIARTTVAGAHKDQSQHAFGGVSVDDCSTYVYDGFDRLKQVAAVAGNPCARKATRYTYDGLDRQRTHVDDVGAPGETTTNLTYDGAGTATVAELPTAAGTNPVVYELDSQGGPMAYRSGTEIQFLAGNGQGDITTVTTDSATANSLACTSRFDPFGSAQAPDATTCSATNTKNDFFYRGGRLDQSTGQYQFGSRHYDPKKSAFLTPDSYRTEPPDANLSIGTDPLTRNTYTYVNGDPVNFVDPDGHLSRGFCEANDVPDDQCTTMIQKAEKARQRQAEIERILARHPDAARPAASLTGPAWVVLGLEAEIQKAAAEFDLDPKLLRRLLSQEGGWAALDGLAGEVVDRRRSSLGIASIRANDANLALARKVFDDPDMSRDELANHLRSNNAFSVRLSAAILRNNITTYKLDSTGIKEETEYRAFMSYALSPGTIDYLNRNDWDFAAIRERNFPKKPVPRTTMSGTTTTMAFRPEIDRDVFDAAYQRARYYAWWDQNYAAIGM